MQTFSLVSLMALVALNGIFVNGTPVPASETGPELAKRVTITRVVNCKEFGTHESCDTMCAAIWCFGLPEILHREKDSKMKENARKESGQKLFPFQSKNDAKYNLNKRTPQCQTADEYPFASSVEGGIGLGTPNKFTHSIIHGTTIADSNNQAELASKVWKYDGKEIQNSGSVRLQLGTFDPKKSPFCDAWDRQDDTICKDPSKTKFFYYRSEEKTSSGSIIFKNPPVTKYVAPKQT